MAEPRELRLLSPAYGEPIFYKWPLVITKRLDEPTEIAETIRLVCEDFPELKYAVENVILKDYDATDFDSMNQLCQRYNKAIKNILQLWKGRAPPPRMFQPPSKELLRHIINLAYSHAINEPEKLNLYEPFSPEVYGETSFDMIAQILEEIQISEGHTFLDLGSGVGQVVLQAAASNRFKECIGVEKADTPAMYAKEMEVEFKKWMDWFGKIYTDFTLEKGDFLDDKWRETINDCGIVFVNNFAFGPVVNHHLKTRFQTMKEGSQVVSSREFVPRNFKFNKRNLSELGAMIRVSEIKPKSDSATVSWTGNSVSYFLHIVDRTRLEKYFSILKKKKEGQDLDEDEMSLCSETTNSADSNGTPVELEKLEENLDDLYLGTTTRHQWQLLTDTINQSKKETQSPQKVRNRKKTPPNPLLKQSPLVNKSAKVQMKDKILQKYGNQKLKKRALLSKSDSVDSGDSSESSAPKSKVMKTKKVTTLQDLKKKKQMAMEEKKLSMKRVRKPSKKLRVIEDSTTDWKPSSDDEETDTSSEVSDSDISVTHVKKRAPLPKTEVKPKPKPASKTHVKVNGKLGVGKTILPPKLPSSKTSTKPTCKPQANSKSATKSIAKPTAKPVTKPAKPSTRPSNNESLEVELDRHFATMKNEYLDFIKRMNTKEYADRLKVMIECETAKKKLLSKEISKTEKIVSNLISESLQNFSSRLVELDMAVKTPVDLLSKSHALAHKHRDLENKVVHMEIEVLNLEEKYKTLYSAHEQKNRSLGLERVHIESEDDLMPDMKSDRKKDMETKLCGAILGALNHRRSLMDLQSSLSEQISILEKISHTDNSKDKEDIFEVEEKEPVKHPAEEKVRPKAKPVALVPPRMLADNKKNTVSPEMRDIATHPSGNDPLRSRRGRRFKRSSKYAAWAEEHPRSSSAHSESSQGSKTDIEERFSSATPMRSRGTSALNSLSSSTPSFISNPEHRYLTSEQRNSTPEPRTLTSENQNLPTEQRYMTYHTHEQREPITFPTTVIDTFPSKEKPKFSKQQFKSSIKSPCTFGKLSFNENQRNSRHDISPCNDRLHQPEKALLSPSHDKWSRPLHSPQTMKTEITRKSGGKITPSSTFSLPIGSLVLSASTQQEPVSRTSSLNTPIECRLTSSDNDNDDECGQTQNISTTYQSFNQCISSTPIYSINKVNSNNSNNNNINVTNILRTSPLDRNVMPTLSIAPGLTLPGGASINQPFSSLSDNIRTDVNEEIRLPLDSPFTTHSVTACVLNADEKTRVWTSSTFSVAQIQQPSDTSRTSLTNSPSSIKSISSNSDLNVTTLSPPEGMSTDMVDDRSLSTTDGPKDIENACSVVTDLRSLTPCPTEEQLPKPKKGTGRLKTNRKRNENNSEKSCKNNASQLHPLGLQSENLTSGRGPPGADGGLKRKMDESFHWQYSSPDVEDHFRSSFNKLCQDANREAALITNLQNDSREMAKSPTSSMFNSNIITQIPLYRPVQNFPSLGEGPASAFNEKHGDISIINTMNHVATLDERSGNNSRNHKDVIENLVLRSPATNSSIGSASFFPTCTSSTLHCSNTLKLVKSNVDGTKGPPVTLLIPAKTTPNDFPAFPKMAVYPSPSPKMSQLPVSVVNQETTAKSREIAKQNQDPLFLSNFSGATFIDSSALGTYPTFIRSAGDVIRMPQPAATPAKGKRPRNSGKKSGTNSRSTADSAFRVDLKSPSKSSANPVQIQIPVPVNNAHISNVVNQGFRPPILRNPLHHLQNLPTVNSDIRSRIRPRILASLGGQRLPVPTIQNRFIASKSMRSPNIQESPSLPSSFANQNVRSVIEHVKKSKTTGAGSPTFNSRQFLLLNMPGTVGCAPDNDSGHGYQRQHSLTSATSPTFPPPNS